MTETPKRKRGRPSKADIAARNQVAEPDRNLVTPGQETVAMVQNPPIAQNQIASAPKTLSEQRDERRAARMSIVLEVMATGQSATAGAIKAGVDYTTPYKWRAEYPDFARAWDEAVIAGTHTLEDEARRRAVEGTERPVFQRGVQVGSVIEYSDNLLIRMLEKRDAGYRQTKVSMELTGANGGPIQIEAVRSRVLGKLAALTVKVIDVTPDSGE